MAEDFNLNTLFNKHTGKPLVLSVYRTEYTLLFTTESGT
jgi:hypothetical protein